MARHISRKRNYRLPENVTVVSDVNHGTQIDVVVKRGYAPFH